MKIFKEFNDFISESSNYDLSIEELKDGEYVVYARKNGKELGNLHFFKNKFKPSLKATSIFVDPSYRGRGIGSAMYFYAERELNLKFIHSEKGFSI